MSFKRILVVKLGAIGDVVMTLPALRALREEHGDAPITVLIGRHAAPLLERHPAVDRLWIIDENIFWQKRWRPLLSLFLKVARGRFEAVYILHWSVLFHVFFWLAGIGHRFGFAREGRSFRLTRAVPYREVDPALHNVDQYLRAVTERWAQPKTHVKSELFFTPEEEKQIDARLAGWGASFGRPWVAIAPGGGNNPKRQMPTRRWPIEHYAALAKLLEATEAAQILLLGDSSERPLIEPLEKTRRLNLAGRLSLREAALVLKKCRLFIGNDSGLMHIADAVGTPFLAFFGPTTPQGKAPRQAPRAVLYRQEPCSPCYHNGVAPPCPYGLKCLWGITPDQALASVQPLLHPQASAHVP